MSTTKKPGNEPDANDMSVDIHPVAATDADPAEEEAAKLGDFA